MQKKIQSLSEKRECDPNNMESTLQKWKEDIFHAAKRTYKSLYSSIYSSGYRSDFIIFGLKSLGMFSSQNEKSSCFFLCNGK